MNYTKQLLEDFYNEEGLRDDSTQHRVYSKPQSLARMNLVKKFLEPHIQGAKCLEIGSAEGMYCAWMADIGAQQVVGVEISVPKILRAEKRSKVLYLQGDWDDLPFMTLSYFDVALATEVLEHSLNPQTVVTTLMSFSNKLIASVPIREHTHDDPIADKTGHIQTFNKESFLELFKDYKVMQYEETEFGTAVVGVTK